MLYRRYLHDLEEWYSRPDRKPLMVWGARQCGKTYLVRDIFAEGRFPGKYVYIDCRAEPEVCGYIESHPRAKDVLSFISLRFDMEIDGSTLVIFDEAQECPAVITLMKYFCQDCREIPVIVTGSMVRIRIKRKKRGKSQEGFMFPVGKINEITITPLSFDEFLYNRNLRMYRTVTEAYRSGKPLDAPVHRMAMDLLYEYLMVGGMPEAVATMLETGSYTKARNIIKELYANYLSDMELYQASPESIVRSKAIFSNIYPMLERESKNFSPSAIEKGAKNRDMVSPIDWLSEARIINVSHLLKEHITIPLRSSERSFRVYLADMGMFSYQSGTNPASFLSDDGRNALSGIFFENYVAEEFSSRGIPLFYWKGKSDSEFEFVVHKDGVVIPVDAKKGKGSVNSLKRFREHNPRGTAVKISANNSGYDEASGIRTIPLYQAFMFADEIVSETEELMIDIDTITVPE